MSGSTFGELFRVTNFGESHGPAIGCVIDGCPPAPLPHRSPQPARCSACTGSSTGQSRMYALSMRFSKSWLSTTARATS